MKNKGKKTIPAQTKKVSAKTIQQLSLEEETLKLQEKLAVKAKLEKDEIAKFIDDYLKEKGYSLSARMILEAGKAPSVQPFIFKIPEKNIGK
jgi:hypothetical protein